MMSPFGFNKGGHTEAIAEPLNSKADMSRMGRGFFRFDKIQKMVDELVSSSGSMGGLKYNTGLMFFVKDNHPFCASFL